MRTLIVVMLLCSVSAFAQVRVKENIKQQSISTSDDGSEVKVIKAPVKTTKSKKQ